MMASKCNPVGYIVQRQYDDSIVVKNKLFKERLNRARNLYRKDLLGHYGCVNAIEFSDEGELLISGGDDRRVLLWSVPEAIFDQGTAITMETRHFSNIFCLSFDSTNSKIFSGGNDDQVLVHDAKTGHIVRKLPHVKPVYGLSVNPENDSVLATAGDDGRIIICDIREPNGDSLVLAKQKMGFHSVKYNPLNARLLVTANSEEGIALWDVRKPRDVYIHYDGQAGPVSGISACFNSDGSRVLALRRRLPPALYASHAAASICQFYHPHYYNSCTMKTCAFAGDNDEYVLSGSDDFNLYMWKVPEEDVEWGTSHLVLNGHRSIVNQVRYNRQCNLIASSGVEKMVKLWSTLPIGSWSGSLQTPYSDTDRPVYSHDEYIYLVGGASTVPSYQQSSINASNQPQPQQQQQQQRITHDYSEHSTQEDARMMAFFDSLIQREIEGWESRSEDTFTSDSDSDTFIQEKIRLSWQSLLRGRKQAEESTRKHKPNRIAQLIAQKRNRLAKMAHWKSKTLVQRLSTREKHNKRASKRIHKYRPKDSRHASKYTTSRHHKHSATAVTQPTTNGTSTSQQQQPSSSSSTSTNTNNKRPHHNTTRAASERRRERQLLEMLESLPAESTNGGAGSGARKRMKRGGDRNGSGEGSSGRNLREEHSSNGSDQPQHIIDMPSTSTGITSSASHNHHVTFNRHSDSDDDFMSPRCARELNREEEEEEAEEPGQLVNVLPTPLNGTHNVYAVNVLEVSAGSNNDSVGNVVSVGTNTDLQTSDSDTDSYEDLSYLQPSQSNAQQQQQRSSVPQNHNRNKSHLTARSKGKTIINNNKGSVNSKSSKQKLKPSTSTRNSNNNTFKSESTVDNNSTRKLRSKVLTKPTSCENDDVLSVCSSSSNSSNSSNSNSSNSSSSNSSSSNDEEAETQQDRSSGVISEQDQREDLVLLSDQASDSESVENELIVENRREVEGLQDELLEEEDYGGTTEINGARLFREEEDMVTPIKRAVGIKRNRSNMDSGYALASSSSASSRYYRKRRHQRDSSDQQSPLNTNSRNGSTNNNSNRNRTRSNSCSSSADTSSSDGGGNDSSSSDDAATPNASSYYQRLRKQRAKKARLNLRKQMQVNGDSDSN